MHVTRHPLSAASRGMANIPLDEALIGRLEASFGRQSRDSGGLIQAFYKELFTERPALRWMFPAELANHERQFVETLTLVVANLRAPERIRAEVERVGRKHRGLGAMPGQYAWVVAALIRAMRTADADGWSAELEADWTQALGLVAMMMINAPETAA